MAKMFLNNFVFREVCYHNSDPVISTQSGITQNLKHVKAGILKVQYLSNPRNWIQNTKKKPNIYL